MAVTMTSSYDGDDDGYYCYCCAVLLLHKEGRGDDGYYYLSPKVWPHDYEDESGIQRVCMNV